MASYEGKAPLTMCRTTAPTTYVDVLAGAPVPDNIDPDDLKRLVDEGYLVEVNRPAEDAGDDGPPAKSATKADWEAYARSQGATDDDLQGVTKEQLVENYGD